LPLLIFFAAPAGQSIAPNLLNFAPFRARSQDLGNFPG
jgi:hypothetical protein